MRRQRGFTLIEVLVATAVVAIGLGAFISGGAHYADYARYIHDRTIAQWVANNQLVQYQLAKNWPSTGKHEDNVSMANMKWHWVADVKNSPDPTVRRIDLHVYRVTGNQSDDNPTATISGFVTQHIKAVNGNKAGNTDGNGSQSDQSAAEQLESASGR